MNIGDLISKSKQFVGDNSTTILTTMGVSGVVTTAVLTGRASFKAALIIDKETNRRIDTEMDPDPAKREPKMTTQDKVKMVWPLYVPPVIAGASTITAIVASNQIASRRVAGLVLAQGITEKAFQEYKEKVRERFGASKARDVRDDIAQDHVNRNPVSSREVILAGMGEVLCFDILSGRYFKSSVEEIKKAENEINFEIVNHMSASLSSFYDKIGLPATGFSDTMGFNLDHRCEVSYSTTMSSDDRPCIAIDFHMPPVVDYGKFY